jgi:hypothetical protein
LAAIGLVSTLNAQPPEPKAPPVSVTTNVAPGQVIADTTGMATLPIRTVGASSGPLSGRITQGGIGLANRKVSLIQNGKVVVSGVTGADGSFTLAVPAAGDYVFVSGPYDAAGRRVIRVGANNGDVQVVSIGGGAGSLVGVADQPSVVNPIGTVGARNDHVLFSNNVFTEGGARRYAGNEVAYLENSAFRGIVTQPVALGVRRPVGGASLYLIQNGVIVGRTTSNPDGSFAIPGVSPGVYSLVAVVGGSQLAAVAPPAPVVDGVAFVDGGTGVASPYYAGAAGGVVRPLAVRFPFAAVAAQGIEIRDGAADGAPAAAPAPSTAEFRIDGSTEPAINVAFSGAAGAADVRLPVVNLSPVPWADLSPVMGNPSYDSSVGVAPIPPVNFGPGPIGGFGGGGGGFGGGFGGGGFGGAGALAGLAAAGAIAAAAAGGRGGGGNTFISPSSPLRP